MGVSPNGLHTFLAVSLVAVEFNQESDSVLTPVPRGKERTVMDHTESSGLAMKESALKKSIK